MPSKATVRGILQNANLTPVIGGTIVATLHGSDVFDGGTRIVTNRVQATTGPDGHWALDLIVNGEGEGATSSWSIEIYNEFASQVHKAANLFVATSLPITLGDLEKTSMQNKKAATDASFSRLLVVTERADYDALPASERRDNDLIAVTGA